MGPIRIDQKLHPENYKDLHVSRDQYGPKKHLNPTMTHTFNSQFENQQPHNFQNNSPSKTFQNTNQNTISPNRPKVTLTTEKCLRIELKCCVPHLIRCGP